MTVFEPLLCPLCGAELCREDRAVRCASGHTFDIARAGYVNLLPPGKGKNAHTGDEKTMVRARVDFLSKGYYAPVSDAVAEFLRPHLPAPAVLADLGCGEGYHTCRIAEQLGIPVTAYGFDASKYAADYASRRARTMGFLPKDGVGAPFADGEGAVQTAFFPANLFHLPLRDQSVDAAVSMFAPIAAEETHRILKPGGVLAVVSSGREHLLEMRELLYEEVHLSDPLLPQPEGFRERDRRTVRYTMTVENRADLEALFVMTPFYYKTTEAGRARLLERDSLTVTVDVQILLLEAF